MTSQGNEGASPEAPATRHPAAGWRRWTGSPVSLLILPVVAVVGIAVAERWTADEQPAQLTEATILSDAGFGPANYGAELDAARQQLALNEERVANGSDQWLRREGLARANLALFKMTADPLDLQAANLELDTAQGLAPHGTGPLLSQAELAMVGHDLNAAEAYLDRFDAVVVPPSAQARATAVALRGDIAFYRGDMSAASSSYNQADALARTSGTAIRRAVLAKSQGRFDAAVAHVFEAAQRDSLRTPRGLASYAMQIGMIESARGNYEEARNWYRNADELFPGSWLTQLYLAEADAMAGDLASAVEALQVQARQTGDPQAYDATAFLLLEQGRTQESQQFSDRAATMWRERIAMMPQAYMAHAFENELAFGAPARALELARRNLAERPYGDAHILMAEALLANSRPDDARRHLLVAEEQGWRSAPLYARLSEAEMELGNDATSRTAAEKARELNPHIFDDDMGRLWFGHG